MQAYRKYRRIFLSYSRLVGVYLRECLKVILGIPIHKTANRTVQGVDGTALTGVGFRGDHEDFTRPHQAYPPLAVLVLVEIHY